MPNIRLTHPKLSPNAAAAAAKVSPEIRELIKRSGKKPVREYTLGEEIFNGHGETNKVVAHRSRRLDAG
ncbi:hypothetical protein, partial [Adlercreutzia sp. DFI.6.23]|uniref:hypothetical protein n=1 Tax=Adlercreutzia sp. DFI.6.23 TaxID=2963705 RepID=UPI00210A2B5F